MRMRRAIPERIGAEFRRYVLPARLAGALLAHSSPISVNCRRAIHKLPSANSIFSRGRTCAKFCGSIYLTNIAARRPMRSDRLGFVSWIRALFRRPNKTSVEATWLKVEEAYLQVDEERAQTLRADRPSMLIQEVLRDGPRQTAQLDCATSAAPDAAEQGQRLPHVVP